MNATARIIPLRQNQFQPRVKPRKRTFFQKYCDEWLESQSAGLAPSSVARFELALRKLSDWLKSKDLTPDMVTCNHIAAFMGDQLKAGFKRESIIKSVGLARQVFGHLEDDGIVARNPVRWDRLPKLPKDSVPRKAIEFSQYDRLLKECAANPRKYPEWLPFAFHIAWHTGLRLSDVLALQWNGEHSKLDMQTGWITVRPIKTRRYRQCLRFPMGAALHEILYPRWEAWVWRKHKKVYGCKEDDTVLDAIADSGTLGRCFKNAGLTGYSFHSFRHAFVSRLTNGGVNPLVVKRFTGQSISTQDIYAKISDQAMEQALHMADAADFRKGRPT